jgi:geranylgeranyl transferase type-2 subunit beta
VIKSIEIDKHISWILSHHRNDGSFISKENIPSRLSDTYYAVRSMQKIDEDEVLDKKSLLDFVLSCEDKNGGFKNSIGHPPQPQFTSYGLYLLNMTAYMPKLDKEKHISWLASLQAEDGGFRIGKKKDSLINHTYYVFRALARLNGLRSIDLGACSDFIISCQIPGGGFSNHPGVVPQPLFTSFDIYILDRLDCIDRIDIDCHIRWMLDLRSTVGFSNTPGKHPQLNHTYYILRSLSILDTVHNINKKKLLKFIVSAENNKGGFSYRPGKPPNLLSTKHALFILNDFIFN